MPRATSLVSILRYGPRLWLSGGCPPCFDVCCALLHWRPHEPDQFPRDGDRRDLAVLPERQPGVDLVEPVLRPPAVRDRLLWLALLAALQPHTPTRRKAAVSRRLHQHVANPAVARVCDGVQSPAGSTRILGRHQAHIGHQLARVLEALEVVINEVGFRPLDRQDANLFFRLVNARYEKGSIVLTSNKHVRHWPEIFAGDEILTTAIPDRLLHHVHNIHIDGRSYRLREIEGLLRPSNPTPTRGGDINTS